MIKLLMAVCSFLIFSNAQLYCQTPEYLKEKSEKIEAGSPFTKIINRELPADIVYEDESIIAFVPLSKQAKVHLLIVPKKEIETLNEARQEDALLLGNMLLIAAKLAKENGIENSGYRISLNLNEDAGQSVFHIHMHLLGGNTLGPMVDRID
ncbi:histidine triad nucleotide-binding protein [Lutimonas sp.]|uniref:histidine triad nucleotide-binding protein n=1 Tax=Lutimonas sp. TaxID=1872403 RepID=UPI003D9BA4C5